MNKFRAVKTDTEDGRFDSKMELRRWYVLKDLEKAGEISGLLRQVSFTLNVNGRKLGKYVADFTYTRDGKEVVEDVKGVLTPLYRWKKKHLKAEYGISILETR